MKDHYHCKKVCLVDVEPVSHFVADQAAERSANVQNDSGSYVREKYVEHEYQEYFYGMIEQNVPSAKVGIYRLEEEMHDLDIEALLGIGIEFKFAHFFHLISQQLNGQEGFLATNGKANIILRYNHKNHPYWVQVRWEKSIRRWDIGAGYFSCQRRREKGDYVLKYADYSVLRAPRTLPS